MQWQDLTIPLHLFTKYMIFKVFEYCFLKTEVLQKLVPFINCAHFQDFLSFLSHICEFTKIGPLYKVYVFKDFLVTCIEN